MDLDRSIDFLLENGNVIVKYRLHREILRDLGKTGEENLLEQVCQTPNYRLVEGYQKENGYIGIGMHSWEKFKETPLQDGEVAARLLASYGIPKERPIIRRFVDALVNEEVLEQEFSYYRPEITRLRERYLGNGCGWGLQLLIDAVISLLGYGDEHCWRMIRISLDAFDSILPLSGLTDIAKFDPDAKRKYNYPFLDHWQYWPCMYHLEILSHTRSWRNAETLDRLAAAINHLNAITPDDSPYHIRLGSRYYAPCGGFSMPIKPYGDWRTQLPNNRRLLLDIARIGIGDKVDATRQTADMLHDLLHKNPVLDVRFENSYEKRKFKLWWSYFGPYCENGLAEDRRVSDLDLRCSLTFWAVRFLHEYHKNRSA